MGDAVRKLSVWTVWQRFPERLGRVRACVYETESSGSLAAESGRTELVIVHNYSPMLLLVTPLMQLAT